MLTQAASFSLIMLPASFLPTGEKLLMVLKEKGYVINIENNYCKRKTIQIHDGMWK
jgi:hypothetical protein